MQQIYGMSFLIKMVKYDSFLGSNQIWIKNIIIGDLRVGEFGLNIT